MGALVLVQGQMRSEGEMPLLLLAIAQAISAAPPEKIDLTLPQPCPAPKPAGDEVIVCANASGGSPYRIAGPPTDQAQLPRAQVQLGNSAVVGAETESADVGGFTSNRAMLRLKLKF